MSATLKKSVKKPQRSKTVNMVKKAIETNEVENIPTVSENEPETKTEPETKVEIKPEVKTEIPLNTEPKLNTLDSTSMLNDLMSETDKDSEGYTDEFEDEPEPIDEFEAENNLHVEDNLPPKKENFSDKVYNTITSDGEDWENPADFKKMCSINAMMYVEGGAILLSFIGQLISGDWSKEGETKYMPSEERRKLIRAPLAKKLELSKNRSKNTPMGALITAIIFTIVPVIIVAFKDRKAKIEKERDEIERIRLADELAKVNAAYDELKKQQTPVYRGEQTVNNYKAVKFKRGRHKKDCECEKCVITRLKKNKLSTV